MNKKTLDNEAVYPNSAFAGNKIFSYKEDNTIGATQDPSWVCHHIRILITLVKLFLVNNPDDDLISYKAFGLHKIHL